MPETGSKSSFGWRLIALGSIFFLGLFLGLMSYVVLPQPPSLAPFTGVTRVALQTAEGVREQILFVIIGFVVLGALTGLGYADKLLKPITALAIVTLMFFAVATWWAVRTVPGSSLI